MIKPNGSVQQTKSSSKSVIRTLEQFVKSHRYCRSQTDTSDLVRVVLLLNLNKIHKFRASHVEILDRVGFFYLLFGCLTANFGPLKRGSLTHPMLITVCNLYSTRRLLGASQWAWALRPGNLPDRFPFPKKILQME